ncbi:MAG: OmpA family protein [Zetaproteobacteria bacterium]|nr:OmpA family protein [Zetaproteobacteria bacterium]
MKKYQIMMAAGLLVSLSACATTPNDPNKQAKDKAAMGAMLGAVAGAVVGYNSDSNRERGLARGLALGAVAGGAVGAGVGSYMDKQQAEFNQQLSSERQSNQVEIQRLKNESLKITMNSEVSFDSNSSSMKPAFNQTLRKVANILQRYSKTTVRIVGYTDSRGSEAYNLNLSKQRAKSVAWALQDDGVSHQRVAIEGRGESNPRASNANAAGRQLNRRVEMFIQPNNNIQ